MPGAVRRRARGDAISGLIALLGCARGEPVTVVAVEYGRSERFSARQLVSDAPEGEVRPLSWQVWVVTTPERTILVDTGFRDADTARRWRIDGFAPVVERLEGELGLRASDITDVVVTHGHWDHAGGVADFPGARLWVHADELAWMASKVGPQRSEAGGVRWDDLRALRDHGLTSVVEGPEAAIDPWVVAHRGGGHTPGVMWVEIRTEPRLALTSDVAYLAENVARGVAPGGSADPSLDLAVYDQLAGWTIVPGHDPETLRGSRTRKWSLRALEP